MILWAVLMVVLFVAMIAGMVYLITRIQKFTFMKKLAGGSRKKATLLSTAVITGAVAFFWLLWGFINAVIILHRFLAGERGDFRSRPEKEGWRVPAVLCGSGGCSFYHRLSWCGLVSGPSRLGENLYDHYR